MFNMIKIRKSVFETNSSSSHSFSISERQNYENDLVISKSGVIHLDYRQADDFPKKTNKAKDKLEYLYLWVYDVYAKNAKEIIAEIEKTVIDFTGAKKVSYPKSHVEKGVEIDHESREVFDKRDLVNHDFLKKFIFDPGSWLYVIWDSEYTEELFEDTDDSDKIIVYKLIYDFGEDKIELDLSLKSIVDNYGFHLIRELLSKKYNATFIIYNRDTKKVSFEQAGYQMKENDLKLIRGKAEKRFRLTFRNDTEEFSIDPEIILVDE